MRKIYLNCNRPMCLICLIFMLFIYTITYISGGVDETEYATDGKTTLVYGKITDIVNKNGKMSIHLEKCINDDSIGNNKKKNRKMIAYVNSKSVDDLKIGQMTKVKGTYCNFSMPENDGQFNMRRYYRIRGYEGCVMSAKVIGKSSKYNKYRQFLYNLKEKTKRIYLYYMDDEEAGTLSAMALGDKSGLDEDVKDIYQTAGISHILSLSGLHIATVGMCFYTMLVGLGIGIYLSSFLSAIVIISYGIMTGLSTSTLRALIMFLLAIIARILGRTYDVLSGLSLSSILILFESPYYVYDSGFLLSFLSVIGISVLYPVIYDATQIKKKHKSNRTLNLSLLDAVRQSICISLSATLATLPVSVNTFYRISRYGIILNIVVVPLMSVVLGTGIIAAVIGNTLGKIYPFRLLMQVILYIANRLLELYNYLSFKSSSLAGNIWIIGDRSKTRIVVYITIVAVATLLYSNNMKVENTRYGRGVYRFGLLSLITVAVIILTFKCHKAYTINALSVGQGACNVIYGSDSPTIIVDAGSTDIKNVGKYRVLPFLYAKGIDKIDYLFVTHNDMDHKSGVIEILSDKYSGIKIRNIILSEEDEEMILYAKERDIPVRYMKRGDEIANGEFRIQCFNPAKDSVNSIGTDTNDKSLVLKMKYKGFDALFPGDISSDIEKEIIASGFDVDSDYMCAAHHGSRNSNCAEFLKCANAKIVTISAGKNNSYGHPHKETLERLSKYVPKSKVNRTDESGQISVIWDNNTIIKRFVGNK